MFLPPNNVGAPEVRGGNGRVLDLCSLVLVVVVVVVVVVIMVIMVRRELWVLERGWCRVPMQGDESEDRK